MLTRTIVVVCSVLIASPAWLAAARAQSALIALDGCAILGSVIRAEILAARLGHPPWPVRNPLDTGHNEITLCDQATQSVTRAFAAALRRSDLHVTWGHSGVASDYCLGHLLSRCYPSPDPAMPPFSKEEQWFVMQSWQAVQGAVSDNMALRPDSDIVRFAGDELGRSIRLSLQGGGSMQRDPSGAR